MEKMQYIQWNIVSMMVEAHKGGARNLPSKFCLSSHSASLFSYSTRCETAGLAPLVPLLLARAIPSCVGVHVHWRHLLPRPLPRLPLWSRLQSLLVPLVFCCRLPCRTERVQFCVSQYRESASRAGNRLLSKTSDCTLHCLSLLSFFHE